MATYVLVHGGGHGGWCYRKVKRLLETEGHEVFAPSLTGLAERSPSLQDELHPVDHGAHRAGDFDHGSVDGARCRRLLRRRRP